jgi:Ankyrin repeats (many copies)
MKAVSEKGNDKLKVVDALLKAGADVDAVDSNGYTPLHHCSRCFLFDSMIALVEHGAKISVDGPAEYYPYPSLEIGVSRNIITHLDGMFWMNWCCFKPNRRTLHLILTSPLLHDMLDELGIENRREMAGWTLTPGPDADERRQALIGMKLRPLKDDAWKRRRHLCIDRALWKKPENKACEDAAPA